MATISYAKMAEKRDAQDAHDACIYFNAVYGMKFYQESISVLRIELKSIKNWTTGLRASIR